MAAAGPPAALTPTQAVSILSAFLTSRCSDQLEAVLLERDANAHYAVKLECAPPPAAHCALVVRGVGALFSLRQKEVFSCDSQVVFIFPVLSAMLLLNWNMMLAHRLFEDPVSHSRPLQRPHRSRLFVPPKKDVCVVALHKTQNRPVVSVVGPALVVKGLPILQHAAPAHAPPLSFSACLDPGHLPSLGG